MAITTLMQPGTYRQKLRRSMQLYQNSFSHVFLLALLIAIIAFVPRLYTLFIGQEIFSVLPLNSLDRLWLLLTDLVWVFFFAALLWRMYCVIKGAHEKISEDLKVALRKLPFIIAAAIIEIILISILTFCLIFFIGFLVKNTVDFSNSMFPSRSFFIMTGMVFIYSLLSIYLFFLFILYFPLIVIEQKNVFNALKNSILLVAGHFWQTFWFLLTPAIVYVILLLCLKYVLNMSLYIYFTEPATTYSWETVIIQIIIFAFYIPWYAAVLLIQLGDLEARKKV